MAVKRKPARTQKKETGDARDTVAWRPAAEPVKQIMAGGHKGNKRTKMVLIGVVVIGAVLLWWWKTSTWPVVAMVGSRPITRFEVEQALFKQYGQSVIEGLVTQKQIEEELERQNIRVEPKDVDGRIDEIKASLGPGANFDQELKNRGMDLPKLKALIEIQLRLNKAVEAQAAVSPEEIDNYVKENGKFLSGATDDDKKKEAEQILKQDKMNGSMEKWVEEAKKKSSIWRLYPLPTVVPTVAPQPQITPQPTPSSSR